ncbi:MAG TPA: ABC transporter ATP-binding protein [Streptosporangiaceae bacterium]|nr:ABC transporter ATP-binding protein [Streptosporangiaceae bacterium]
MPAEQLPPVSRLAQVARLPGAAKPDPILVAENVTRSFGGLDAVRVARLEIQRGAITALIGPNGAGKTTLFNLLTGFDRADSGRWWLAGRQLAGLPAYRIARAGLVRTFQLTKSLTLLTVLENLKLAGPQQAGERFLTSLARPLWRAQELDIERRADELLTAFRLDRMRDEYAGTLSGGQRKLLELARALMAAPAMIMLDEPMAGINPALTQTLLGHITQLRDQGMTILFVEHDMDVVMGVSDWVICMAEGQVIAEGPPASIGSDRAVIDAYLGAHHGRRAGGGRDA